MWDIWDYRSQLYEEFGPAIFVIMESPTVSGLSAGRLARGAEPSKAAEEAFKELPKRPSGCWCSSGAAPCCTVPPLTIRGPNTTPSHTDLNINKAQISSGQPFVNLVWSLLGDSLNPYDHVISTPALYQLQKGNLKNLSSSRRAPLKDPCVWLG